MPNLPIQLRALNFSKRLRNRRHRNLKLHMHSVVGATHTGIWRDSGRPGVLRHRMSTLRAAHFGSVGCEEWRRVRRRPRGRSLALLKAHDTV